MFKKEVEKEEENKIKTEIEKTERITAPFFFKSVC